MAVLGLRFCVRAFSLVVASGGHSSSRCAGLSLLRPLLLWSTVSRRAGSVIVAHGPSCSAACGIFPDQGSNPCPLHWQADSQPLRHQGSPGVTFKEEKLKGLKNQSRHHSYHLNLKNNSLRCNRLKLNNQLQEGPGFSVSSWLDSVVCLYIYDTWWFLVILDIS